MWAMPLTATLMTPPGRILLRERGYVISLTGLVLASSADLLASTYHLPGWDEAVDVDAPRRFATAHRRAGVRSLPSGRRRRCDRPRCRHAGSAAWGCCGCRTAMPSRGSRRR